MSALILPPALTPRNAVWAEVGDGWGVSDSVKVVSSA